MARLGLVVGGIALVGLVLLTVLPALATYHPEGVADTCLAACMASDNLLARAGPIPGIFTFAVAGSLVGVFFFRNPKREILHEREMSLNSCQYCGKQIEVEWSVCPFCGQSTVTKD